MARRGTGGVGTATAWGVHGLPWRRKWWPESTVILELLSRVLRVSWLDSAAAGKENTVGAPTKVENEARKEKLRGIARDVVWRYANSRALFIGSNSHLHRSIELIPIQF